MDSHLTRCCGTFFRLKYALKSTAFLNGSHDQSHAGQSRPVIDAPRRRKHQAALFKGHLKVTQKLGYDIYFLVATECER
jgi:hypothetical protein